MHKSGKIIAIFLISMFPSLTVIAQISPGDLSAYHSHLEGLSNCTQCHVLGNKVSGEKCLSCHKEVQARISLKKGYHSSVAVIGKQCVSCHSDHNGKNFQLVRLDQAEFDHTMAGYTLSLPHAKKTCTDCHNTKFITDQKIKDKKFTYLGLQTSCLSCHTDYHQKSLSYDCLTCHSQDAFKPATKFNHNNTGYHLVGKHAEVECSKCHKVTMTDGKKFQQFKGVQFTSCTSCHKDPHQDKFGQNCSKCHSEESFKAIRGVKNFDHNKTDYKLEGKHMGVSCTACHKVNFNKTLKFQRCTDCHTDYHKKQFVKNGQSPDCSQCHSVKGFNLSMYSPDQHEQSRFQLKGAHLATPCFECHKKQTAWSFRNIGMNCKDCHPDIHKSYLPEKNYPQADCKVCHNENRWAEVSFNHTNTGYNLSGAHAQLSCRSCHYKTDKAGATMPKYAGLSQNCSECHMDKHYNQFEKNGVTNCNECHDTENWKASKFDHNKTAFKLDGRHINVSCIKCHKPQQQGSYYYISYKLKVFTCESCHS